MEMKSGLYSKKYHIRVRRAALSRRRWCHEKELSMGRSGLKVVSFQLEKTCMMLLFPFI